MNKLINYLNETTGPWAVGFVTHNEEFPDLTAGSYYLMCQSYQINEEGDCVTFIQEQGGTRTGELTLPLLPLEYLDTDNEGTMFYLNGNFHVTVEGFTPNTILYLRNMG